MGDVARMMAGQRVKEALRQRTEEIESVDKMEDLVYEVAGVLQMRAFDAEELNKTAREIAADPDEIRFPE